MGQTSMLLLMAEGINVRFKGELKRFIDSKVDEGAGLYGSTSEYIRDLVRRDYEAEEARRWNLLKHALAPGISADTSEFHPLDADVFLQKARTRRQTNVD